MELLLRLANGLFTGYKQSFEGPYWALPRPTRGKGHAAALTNGFEGVALG